MEKPDIYVLYERAVQSPDIHVALFNQIYAETRGGLKPSKLREDFCGTFAISCAWVESDPRNTALSIDLDPVPLKSGRQRNLSKLTPEQRKRVDVRQDNVLKVKSEPMDVIGVCNFSFFIFKTREELRKYFEVCRRSLGKNGVLVLEMSGGPGMIEETRERKQIRLKGTPPYQYTWDQKSFDPITHNGHYAIHFRLRDGTTVRDAFTYDWRLWSIPEVRELLAEAGFEKSIVYWEVEVDGEGTGEYKPHDKGTNDYCWCAYLVGVR